MLRHTHVPPALKIFDTWFLKVTSVFINGNCPLFKINLNLNCFLLDLYFEFSLYFCIFVLWFFYFLHFDVIYLYFDQFFLSDFIFIRYISKRIFPFMGNVPFNSFTFCGSLPLSYSAKVNTLFYAAIISIDYICRWRLQSIHGFILFKDSWTHTKALEETERNETSWHDESYSSFKEQTLEKKVE